MYNLLILVGFWTMLTQEPRFNFDQNPTMVDKSQLQSQFLTSQWEFQLTDRFKLSIFMIQSCILNFLLNYS